MLSIKPVKQDKIGAGKAALVNKYERKFRRGSLIFIEGELSTEMFIIKNGKVRILKQEGETTIELAVLGAGSVLGELSLLDHQPRGATAQVVEDLTATIVDKELLKKTLEAIPSWLASIIQVVVKRLRDTMKRTSDDVVRKSVAGVIKVLLLLLSAEGRKKDGKDGAVSLPLPLAKEVIYSTIGLGGMEAENVFLHLILKSMLLIRKNELGQEFLHFRDLDVLQMYMSYLRTHQRDAAMPGENLSPAAVELLKTILEAGEKGGKKMQEKIISVGLQQIEMEQERRTKERHLDMDALEQLLAAKLLAEEQAVTQSAHGTHKRNTVIYNKEMIGRVLNLQQWLAVFKEDVKF